MKLRETRHTATDREGVARGGCLTAFLVFIVLANAVTVLFYLIYAEQVRILFPRLSSGGLFALWFGALLNIAFAIMVWQWRRVGVYGLIILALLVFPFNLYIGIPAVQAMIGLLGPVILALLVRSNWNRFI